MQTIAIKGTPRTKTGKSATRADLRNQQIPCVLYGDDVDIQFTTTFKEIKDLVYTPDFKIAEITVDGKTYRSILKDVQFHPVKDTIRHVDFLVISDSRPIKVELPVKFVGVSPGVRVGGKLIQNLRKIKVKTTADKLIDVLTLDISKVELGQSIRVRDIQVEEGIEIMSPPATPVATVEIPRALKSAGAKEAAVADSK